MSSISSKKYPTHSKLVAPPCRKGERSRSEHIDTVGRKLDIRVRSSKYHKTNSNDRLQRQVTHPYLDPEWVRYGIRISIVFASLDMNIGSSPFCTTNSSLHNLSAAGPNRPHTAGRSALQMNLKFGGKKRS